MIEVTEPQVWVLIGVFSAAIFAMLGIVTASFTRTLTTAIGALRESMEARFSSTDAKFEAMDAKFEGLRGEMNARFETIDVRLDNLDRDVQSIATKVFGD